MYQIKNVFFYRVFPIIGTMYFFSYFTYVYTPNNKLTLNWATRLLCRICTFKHWVKEKNATCVYIIIL